MYKFSLLRDTIVKIPLGTPTRVFNSQLWVPFLCTPSESVTDGSGAWAAVSPVNTQVEFVAPGFSLAES